MATINQKKLKFTVYGRGYDDSRGNSGNGSKEPLILRVISEFAEFDASGRYCWIGTSSPFKLIKYDTLTWTEVPIPDELSACRYVNQPKNSSDNIGIAADEDNSHVYLFDLTTNEILASGSVAQNTFNVSHDCMKVDDNTWRFCTLGQTRFYNKIHTLTLDPLSASTRALDNTGFCGWIDTDSIYSREIPQWFDSHKAILSINANGTTEWYAMSRISGGTGYPNVDPEIRGLPVNGKLYVPSYVGEKWVMGVYNASSAPDFDTPSPQGVYGEFPSRPTISPADFHVAYTTDKGLAVFGSTLGVYATDYQNLTKIDTATNIKPLATTNDVFIGRLTTGGDAGYAKIIEF